MLVEAQAVDLEETNVRLDVVSRLDSLPRLLPAEEDRSELARYLGPSEDELSEIVDCKFRTSPSTGKFRPGRYNLDSFGAFYLARTEDAAIAETMHYANKSLSEAVAAHAPVHLEFTEWQVRTKCEDLLPVRESEPRLTADSWEFCQSVGDDVRSRQDGLIYPSARLNNGENLALFQRHTVTPNPRTNRRISLRLDPCGHLVVDSTTD